MIQNNTDINEFKNDDINIASGLYYFFTLIGTATSIEDKKIVNALIILLIMMARIVLIHLCFASSPYKKRMSELLNIGSCIFAYFSLTYFEDATFASAYGISSIIETIGIVCRSLKSTVIMRNAKYISIQILTLIIVPILLCFLPVREIIAEAGVMTQSPISQAIVFSISIFGIVHLLLELLIKQCNSSSDSKEINLFLTVASVFLILSVTTVYISAFKSYEYYKAPGTVVYVTPAGIKYHTRDCIYSEQYEEYYVLTKKTAIKKAYTPCKVCKPV